MPISPLAYQLSFDVKMSITSCDNQEYLALLGLAPLIQDNKSEINGI